MRLSKIYNFARQGSKVAPNNLKNSIIEERYLRFFSFHTKNFLLTFSTLKKFGFGMAVGLRDMHNFRHLWVI